MNKLYRLIILVDVIDSVNNRQNVWIIRNAQRRLACLVASCDLDWILMIFAVIATFYLEKKVWIHRSSTHSDRLLWRSRSILNLTKYPTSFSDIKRRAYISWKMHLFFEADLYRYRYILSFSCLFNTLDYALMSIHIFTYHYLHVGMYSVC